MRDLNECTAEVFRRGEQRIRERRRKRNRALAVCIPICLIAAVWSAMSPPAGKPEGETLGQGLVSGDALGSAPESLACPYAVVEIQAGMPPEHCEEVTDPAAVAEMFKAIHSLFADAGGNGPGASENFQVNEDPPADEGNENPAQIESASTAKDYNYRITFTAEDGSQAVYHLSGNTLLNVSTNKAIILSGAQAAELAAVLGLSE